MALVALQARVRLDDVTAAGLRLLSRRRCAMHAGLWMELVSEHMHREVLRGMWQNELIHGM
jgi:hypothetical protein